MYEILDLEKELNGKTLAKCYQVGDDELHFVTADGDHLKLYHEQECCEGVSIEDVCGDLDDLIGSPLMVEVATSYKNPADAKKETLEYQDSFTWTFYKFRTMKGSVTVRWYGGSNGYYSEKVDVARVA